MSETEPASAKRKLTGGETGGLRARTLQNAPPLISSGVHRKSWANVILEGSTLKKLMEHDNPDGNINILCVFILLAKCSLHCRPTRLRLSGCLRRIWLG